MLTRLDSSCRVYLSCDATCKLGPDGHNQKHKHSYFLKYYLKNACTFTVIAIVVCSSSSYITLLCILVISRHQFIMPFPIIIIIFIHFTLKIINFMQEDLVVITIKTFIVWDV